MKAIVIGLCVLMLCTSALVAIQGRFAGKHATYSSDDYLALVVNTVNTLEPGDEGIIRYFYSTDSSGMWSFAIVAQGANNFCEPSLYYSPGEIVVSYISGTNKMLAISTDNGLNWQSYEAGRTFDMNPTIYKDGEDYRDFDLKLPYPQWMMDDLASSDDPTDPIFPESFINLDTSMNNTNVYYWGQDVIHSPIRSNGDIYIKQAGGGSNNGWPTFYGPVIISGNAISVSGPIPYDMVFLGGLVENAPTLEYPSLVDTQSILVGPADYSPNRIVKVDVSGPSYAAWMGTIQEPVLTDFPVYETYPQDPLGEPLYTNAVPVRDTIWTPIYSGTCTNRTLKVNSKLWIKGTFSGDQTWIAQDSIFIIGDILLEDTPAGQSPETPMNYTDKVKLISEKSVLMKYGYKDPADGLRKHVARGGGEPFHIYASIFAMGDGEANPRQDGMFTFEYQHPHPSLPSVFYEGELWHNLDLHRRAFPQTSTNPWPPDIDLPWYNPLWPERQPYLERGEIAFWGSVMQKRRGYLHRSLYDSEWPSGGIWNPSIDFCGGTSNVGMVDPILGILLNTRNYPGAVGSGVGYKKNFHPDNRLGFKDLDVLHWNLGMSFGRLSSNGEGGYQTLDYQLVPYIGNPHTPKVMSHFAGKSLFALDGKLVLRDQGGEVELIQQYSAECVALQIKDQNTAYQIKLGHQTKDTSIFIEKQDLLTGAIEELDFQSDLPSTMADLVMLPDSRVLYGYLDPLMQVRIHEIRSDGETPLLCSYDASALMGPYELFNSRLYLGAMGNENVNMLFQLASDMDPHDITQLVTAQIAIPAGSSSYETPSLPPLSLAVYPNPFRSFTNIRVSSLNSRTDHQQRVQTASIAIYNIKGQLVKSIVLDPDKIEEQTTNWDGRDNDNIPCSSGLYLVKLIVNGKSVSSKMLTFIR